ncbi:MAG: hypothetical protein KGL32_08240, partial [candidate division NC10 bacterium]|nr:hypothetical protein [candidate division NC10 bacterium]
FAGGSTDGNSPEADLLQGTDGALYGTTYNGGASSSGTVFKLNTDGSGFTLLHSFAGGSTDGNSPQDDLLQGTDGALYGTTTFGGGVSNGTVFKLQ